MDSVIVSNQEEFNEAVSEMTDLIQCAGEIFTLDNDDAAGLEVIEGLQNPTILILTGDETTSMKMDDLENFEDEEDVHQFVVFGIQVKNMIVSSPQKLELVFDDREEFDSWEGVTFDTSKIEIVIKEDEWNEMELAWDSQHKEDLAFIRKYEARLLGVDDEDSESNEGSRYSSYEAACDSYSGTNISVGAIIGAKLRAGYYRYGIFGGKNEIISVNPDSDLVEILDHDTFLKGTGLFNGTEVKRMGFSGELNKSLKDTYTIALSMLGSEMDDEDFVRYCRLEEGDDREIELINSSALEFLNDL
ncbi:hypothetical protein [Photobacterium swingsii]|uniref:hypothetical protein n=1 Tax=Photobacterium swingsii TaxID=680026 RepID=UPI004068AE2E